MRLLQTSPLIASLALETDGELLRRFGGSTTALKNYVGQLIACECCLPSSSGMWLLPAAPFALQGQPALAQLAACSCWVTAHTSAAQHPCTLCPAADANTIFKKEIGVELRIVW